MERLGIGLIGTGFMGKCHALAWNAVKPVFGAGPKADLVALAEVDGALAAQKADEFGFATATADWRDLVANPAIDVISTHSGCSKRYGFIYVNREEFDLLDLGSRVTKDLDGRVRVRRYVVVDGVVA